MLILYTPTYRERKRGTKGINEGFGGTRGETVVNLSHFLLLFNYLALTSQSFRCMHRAQQDT